MRRRENSQNAPLHVYTHGVDSHPHVCMHTYEYTHSRMTHMCALLHIYTACIISCMCVHNMYSHVCMFLHTDLCTRAPELIHPCAHSQTLCSCVCSHVCVHTVLKYVCAPMRKESPGCLEHSTCLPFGAMFRHHHDSAVPLSNSDLPSCLHHHHHMHSCHISGPGKSRHREAWGPCSQTFPTIFSLPLGAAEPLLLRPVHVPH